MDGYNIILLTLSVLAFFVCSFAENYIFKIPILFHVFFKLFTTKAIWLNLLFVIGTTSSIELLFRAIKKLFLEDDDLQDQFICGQFVSQNVNNGLINVTTESRASSGQVDIQFQ